MIHKYWLGQKANVVISKLDEYDSQWRTYSGNPFYDMWWRNSYAYYSNVLSCDSVISSLNFRGDKGELVEMKVPQARSLVRQALTLITKQRLSFQALATLDNYKYIQTMRKTNAILEAEVKDGRLDLIRDMVTEMALVLGTGYFTCLHRFDKGKVIGQSQSGGLIYEGEPVIACTHPIDMLYDFRLGDFRDNSWARITTKRNRYDLMAMYPELADRIASLPSCWERSAQIDQFFAAEDRDMVFVYELIHRPTPALRNGRYISYSDDDCVYYDDDNFYGGIPVEPVIPEGIFTYGVGYPLLSSLLPAQEMYDHEYSVVATNHSALGIRNIAVARNSNIDIKAIPGGLNYVSYTPQNVPGGGKPEVLDFNTPNSDVYNFQDKLLNNMQQMTNLNSAVRGEASSANSGVAIATLTTNALEFMGGYSKAVYFGLENILYWKIKILAKMVKEPRDLTISTQDGVAHQDTYTGDDLEPVKGIKITETNPMMQTMAGRVDIAEKMLQGGLLKSPMEYISVLDGAPTSRIYGNELSENDLILYEKEQILKSQMPTALATDDHARHIREHKSIANNPAVRSDPKLMQIINDHNLEHLRLAHETDPMLMAMANTGVMPQMPPQGMAPPPSPPGENDAPGAQRLPTQSGTPAGPAQPAQDMLKR